MEHVFRNKSTHTRRRTTGYQRFPAKQTANNTVRIQIHPRLSLSLFYIYKAMIAPHFKYCATLLISTDETQLDR